MSENASELRAFIAIELPQPVKAFLNEISSELKKYGSGVKWVRPESIHLTLKFLGAVRADLIPVIEMTVRPLFSAVKPIELSVVGLGAFPSVWRPRVVWAGCQDPTGTLPPLVAGIEDALEPLGFPKEKRPFNPHLTLGRLRPGQQIPDLSGAIRHRVHISGPSFTADHAILFQSLLKPSGAEYLQLCRFDCAPG